MPLKREASMITIACFTFIYTLSMTKPLEKSKLSHLALRRNTKTQTQ